MDKIKKRSEISSVDKWNIELVYKDEDEFNNDLEKIKKEIDKLISLLENFTSSSEDFKNFFVQDEVVSRLLEKLSIYAAGTKDHEPAGSSMHTHSTPL